MKNYPLYLLSLGGLACALASNVALAEEQQSATLGEVTVTGTREAVPLAQTPATIDIIKGEEIRKEAPTHPSEIMRQVPGVWVNVTGGEGHITAIRQPLTTSPVYLYLEDGIPTRSTGFFNHNALYEINVPMAGGIEVNKGPGSALYGSDAIGGVVNVLTHEPPLEHTTGVSLEAGQYGWRRAMLTHGNTMGNDGVRGDLNLTHTDGWRDSTGYDRQSATARWDHASGDNTLIKTIASYSHIDQETAGTSTISESDYLNNPTVNYTPISLRKVGAFRLSSAYEKETGGSLLSLTPYFRNNDMDLLANWSLGYDPTIYNTNNKSFGLLTKYRQDFPEQKLRIITGIDLDYSPGSRLEQSIDTTKVGNIYTSYTLGQTIYDYDVTFKGASPYLHGELAATDKLHVIAGLRYDHVGYDYTNNLSDADISITPSNITRTLIYHHPSSTSLSYSHFSPKLGASYAFTSELSGFVAYNHAFRAPSEGQLFRPGSSLNTLELKPVKVNNIEAGIKGNAGKDLRYEVSVYHMVKNDDILSYTESTGSKLVVNAGKTLHQGLEVGVTSRLSQEVELAVSASYAKHIYEEWIIGGTTTVVDYSGKEMETAPRRIANTRLNYAPQLLNGGRLALEWVSIGRYWIDQTNTIEYNGHNLLNLRANYPFAEKWELFGSVTNLTDRRFAESTSYITNRTTNQNISQYAPGMPRTFYAGVRYNWQ